MRPAVMYGCGVLAGVGVLLAVVALPPRSLLGIAGCGAALTAILRTTAGRGRIRGSSPIAACAAGALVALAAAGCIATGGPLVLALVIAAGGYAPRALHRRHRSPLGAPHERRPTIPPTIRPTIPRE